MTGINFIDDLIGIGKGDLCNSNQQNQLVNVLKYHEEASDVEVGNIQVFYFIEQHNETEDDKVGVQSILKRSPDGIESWRRVYVNVLNHVEKRHNNLPSVVYYYRNLKLVLGQDHFLSLKVGQIY